MRASSRTGGGGAAAPGAGGEGDAMAAVRRRNGAHPPVYGKAAPLFSSPVSIKSGAILWSILMIGTLILSYIMSHCRSNPVLMEFL